MATALDTLKKKQNNITALDALREKYNFSTDQQVINKSLALDMEEAKKVGDLKKYTSQYKSNLKAINKLKNKTELEKKQIGIKTNQEVIDNLLSTKYLNKPTGINVPEQPLYTSDALKQNTQKLNEYESKSIDYKKFKELSNENQYVKYKKDEAEVNLDKTTFWDKINLVNSFWAGLEGAVGFGNYVDENGNFVQLPSKSQLKAAKVSQDSEFVFKALQSATESLGGMTPAMLAGLAGVPGLPETVTFTTVLNRSRNEKLLEGYSKEQALNFGVIDATLETVLGKALGGASKITTGNESLLSESLGKLANKVFKNEAVGYFTSHLASEEIEELMQTVLEPINEHVTLGKYDSIGEALSSLGGDDFALTAVSTLITMGLTEGPTALKINNMKKNIDKINAEYGTDLRLKLDNNSIKVVNDTNIQEKTDNSSNNIINDSVIKTDNQTDQNIISNIEKKVGQTEISLPTVNNALKYSVPIGVQQYLSAKTDNPKINNFRDSVTNNISLNNSKEALDLIKISEKFITEKSYNILFDNTITNEQGQPVNALATTNVNGEVEIRLNTNSDRAGEFLLMHEISHAIKTPEMIDFVNKFAEQNNEFNESIKSLEAMYGKDMISEEVFADICGQLLGNQEFINTLTAQNTVQSKSMIKKIYEAVKRMLNSLTSNGRYKNFVQDLEAKWRNAYKATANNQASSNLTNGNRYSTIGLNGAKKLANSDTSRYYKNLLNNQLNAEEIFNNSNENLEKTNIRSKQETGWFKTKYGDWGTLISDKNSNLLKKLEPNTTYKLGDVLEHNLLYQAYPELKRMRVKTRDIDITGGYSSMLILPANTITNEIYIRNADLNKKDFKKTLLHEINHYIEQKENYDKRSRGANSRIEGIENYRDNLGEIISNETKINADLTQEELDDIILPEQAKSNPQYKNIREKLLESNSNDLLENRGERNALQNLELPVQNKVKNNKVDNKKNSNSSRIINDIQEGLDNSSFSLQKDNQGRTLSKKQQEYFKDSKATDENGNLKVLYHGTPSEFNKFSYEFLGTNGTLLGKGFYLTDDINVAEAYANKGETGKVMELYADIKKPLKWGETTISQQQFKNFVEAVNHATEGRLFADYSGEFSEKGSEQYDSTLNDILMDYEYGGDDIDLVSGILNSTGMSWDKGYEILKNTTGYDGIIVTTDVYDSGEGNVYIPFQSNQIKNVNNTNPTSNEDIRYSQNGNTWQAHLEKNYKATGTRTYFDDIKLPTKNDVQNENNTIKMPKVSNPLEISKLTKEDANTTPPLPTKTYQKGTGESSFYTNITEKSEFLNEDLREMMKDEENIQYYQEITNKDTLEKAYEKLQEGGMEETTKWFNKDVEKGNISAVDITEGWILLKQYQDAGDYQSVVEVAKKMRNIGTKAGQTVQAFNIMNRLTPEGMVYYAQSELSEAYNKMVKNKTKKWIDQNINKFDLTPQEVKFIMDTMNEVKDMQDGYEKRVKLAEIQKVLTDKLPPEKGAGIKAWMRISMLFNPKTQVRNVMGNAIIAPVNYFSDMFSSVVDKQIAKKTGIRTTGTTNLGKYLKGGKKGLYESYNDFKKGINTRNMQGNRFEVTEGKSFNDNNIIGKKLNQVDNLLSFVLDAGDRIFYEATFTNSINNQLELNQTTEATPEMIDIATNEALQRTWQDNNEYTKAVLGIRRLLNKANIKGYGLGDILIPFAKTPANLTKAIVDYSPAGLVKTLAVDAKNLKNSLENGQYTPQLQHRFVQNLGKGFAGTFLYVIGYALANAGIISGENDEDKDVSNFMRNSLGMNSYSIKIGNKSFSYDWAQPIAAPFAIMANYVKQSKENPDATMIDKGINVLNSGFDVLLEQSFMNTINEVLNGNGTPTERFQNAILELPSRSVPTFLKQIADMVDPVTRTSFEYDKPLKSAMNKVAVKVPFLSKTLEPSFDTLGNEIQKYGGKNNLFNVFLNPSNISKGKLTTAGEEIYRLYKETGDNKIMPRVAPYYINSKGAKIVLTNKEKTKFQKISGNIIEENVEALLKDSNYQQMPDIDKASVVNNLVNYSYNKAREDVLKLEMSSEYNRINKFTAVGGTPAQFYATKDTIASFKGDDKKINIINYINSQPMTIEQKAQLIRMEYPSFDTYNTNIVNYINNQNITIEEKIELLELLGFTVKNGKVSWK